MLALADRIERHEVPRERLAPLMALIGEIENGNTWYRYGDGGDAAPSSRMGEHRHGQDSPGHGGA
ncbi:MAG TPA: hypothetical protein PKE29_13430 [Phycisphaerales bacterium]|nr:hypothetical protein [Phycisphaerales bacterium]